MKDKTETERDYELLQLVKNTEGNWCTVFNAIVAAQEKLANWGVDPAYIDRGALRHYARQSMIDLGRIIEARLNGFKTSMAFESQFQPEKEAAARYLFGEYGVDINDFYFKLCQKTNEKETKNWIKTRSRGLPKNPLGED